MFSICLRGQRSVSKSNASGTRVLDSRTRRKSNVFENNCQIGAVKECQIAGKHVLNSPRIYSTYATDGSHYQLTDWIYFLINWNMVNHPDHISVDSFKWTGWSVGRCIVASDSCQILKTFPLVCFIPNLFWKSIILVFNFYFGFQCTWLKTIHGMNVTFGSSDKVSTPWSWTKFWPSVPPFWQASRMAKSNPADSAHF